jgi:hypothetical protein
MGICIGTTCFGPDVIVFNEVMNQFVPHFDKCSKPLLCALKLFRRHLNSVRHTNPTLGWIFMMVLLLVFVVPWQRQDVSRQNTNNLTQGPLGYILFSYLQGTVHVFRFALDDAISHQGLNHDLQLLDEKEVSAQLALDLPLGFRNAVWL